MTDNDGSCAGDAAEARSFVESSLKLAPGATYQIVTTLVSGDHFTSEWIVQPAGLRGSSVGTVRAGKIAGNRDYWNAAPKK